ncbi:DUF707 domain-containing protein [Roseateles sp. DC23W]|uniref:DUF707 domain-containing protein n=1 Tax=Pelomonas dachongensis TaxID=3299029 RepID=A0ABW7EK19_9BURK
MNRRNLVVLRAGDASLHRGWIAEPGRDFDLFISYYGQKPDLHKDDADHYEMRRGPKWSCIGDLLAEHPHLIDRYDAFWFPDDDLAATTETLNRMFGLFHGFGLALAQPALTRDSYYSWNTLLQHPRYVLRHVAFVEVMAPLFDRSSLRACLKTFTESRSGWGLDWVWPELAGRGRRDSIAVLDATPVKHTRPLGGDLYRNNPEMDPRLDEQRLLAQYGARGNRYANKYLLYGGIARVRPTLWEQLTLMVRRLNAQRRMRRTERRKRRALASEA